MELTPTGSLDFFGPGRKLGQCVCLPVHSYINDLPLPMESMNRKIKIVYSMFFHLTISVINYSIEPGVSFCIICSS